MEPNLKNKNLFYVPNGIAVGFSSLPFFSLLPSDFVKN